MFAVIYIPDFFLQAALRHEPELASRPIALIDESLPKPVIVQLTEPARLSGVCPGMTSTQAMARCREILIKPRSAAQEAAAADTLLQTSYLFSPSVEANGERIPRNKISRIEPMNRAADSPSPLNGERAGVRGEKIREASSLERRFMVRGETIHDALLSPRFVENGLSSTAASDPSNQLLSHMTRRRLSIEQWRDAVLFVTGELQPIGGKSLELDDPRNLHRTLYSRVSRLKLNDLLMQFDYPDANVHAEKRAVTTTPVQKLFLLNSPFMIERAKALSKRVAAESRASNAARINCAYQLLFSRNPSRDELKLALAFLRRPETPEMSRWDQYAQMLLASNEMFYVD